VKTSGSPWFKHGFLNTLEHGLTRVADAATSLVLLWVLSPELFSSLALAQAMVAPALLFFISPETVLYRDFAKWREEGTNAVAARLHAFGRFAVGKGQFAFVLALVLAFVPTAATYLDCLCALIWAFALALAPQLSGPEREFLRLSLRLKTLNLISLTQKCFLLGGTVGVVLIFGSRQKCFRLLHWWPRLRRLVRLGGHDEKCARCFLVTGFAKKRR
jgi:O-antigen/teichoic acid export membrane protein